MECEFISNHQIITSHHFSHSNNIYNTPLHCLVKRKKRVTFSNYTLIAGAWCKFEGKEA